MSSTAKKYAHQCIAGSGFAVMNGIVAWRLRPDLWATGQDCAMSMGLKDVEGAKKLSVTIPGIGTVPVFAMSEKRLADRIEEVTGFAVTAIEDYHAPTSAAHVPFPNSNQLHAAQHLDKLRKLSAMEPPAHECVLRKDILKAREELARIEPQTVAKTQTAVEEEVSVPVQSIESDNAADESDAPETAIDRAKELLEEMLSDGPTDTASIYAVAEGEGLSERTMQRASDALGVVKTKTGFSGGWSWAMPETAQETE